jgi:hypothetical protein
MFAGTVMAGYVQSWAGFETTNEGLFVAASITGFLSWTAMGALTRTAADWKWPSKSDEV